MNNNNEQIIQILTDYGLVQTEASLYLAGLELGECGMSIIAKKAGVKRPTAYLIFKTLEKKGLMGSYKTRHGLKFVATKPEILLARAKAKAKNLENVLPQINALIGGHSFRPKISFYEGKEGFLSVVENTLSKPGATIRHFGSLKEVHRVMDTDYDLNYYMPKRIKNRVFLKALYFPDHTDKFVVEVDDKDRFCREIKYLPLKYNSNSSTLIMDDRVIIFGGSQEIVSVVIESKEIAVGEQKKFDLIWDLVGEKKDSKI